MSSTIITNTGAPQGCVLSPVLFTIYTSDCRSTHPDCKIIKYADDTIIVGLINKKQDTTFYQDNINRFIDWCDENYLLLNVKKTKEMVIDLGTVKVNFEDVVIKNESIERVCNYKYLGTIINCNLSWEANIDLITSKAKRRLYFLRKLKEFKIRKDILRRFYDSIIQSVCTFNMICWYGNTPDYIRQHIHRIEKSANRIIGDSEGESIEDLYNTKSLCVAKRILSNNNHPLRDQFQVMRSGVRLRCLKAKTNRTKNSFIGEAIKILNKLPSQERTLVFPNM
jgi:hypothetical protein